MDYRQLFKLRLVVAAMGETQPNPRHGVFFLLHPAVMELGPEVVA